MDILKRIPIEYIPVIALVSLFLSLALIEKLQALFKKGDHAAQPSNSSGNGNFQKFVEISKLTVNGFKTSITDISQRMKNIEDTLKDLLVKLSIIEKQLDLVINETIKKESR